MEIKEIISLNTRRNIANKYREISGKFYIKSYSQEGEDLILNRIFNKKYKGFYVDIGAFHPQRFSNTYIFYKKGWSGINIDARPGSMKQFNSKRSRDINLEIPVSSKKSKLKYYAFNEPAINTFSEELAKERNGKDGYKIIFEKEIETQTLAEIMNNYLPKNISDIDFFSIDVESFDLDVLISNDWSKYIPKVILIEDLQFNIHNLNNSEINKFLVSKGYSFYAKTVNTLFYKLDTFIVD